MSDDRYEPVEIDVDEVKAVTDKAVLCLISGEEVWLPWSQISESNIQEKGDSGWIVIPQWLADKKGLE